MKRQSKINNIKRASTQKYSLPPMGYRISEIQPNVYALIDLPMEVRICFFALGSFQAAAANPFHTSWLATH